MQISMTRTSFQDQTSLADTVQPRPLSPEHHPRDSLHDNEPKRWVANSIWACKVCRIVSPLFRKSGAALWTADLFQTAYTKHKYPEKLSEAEIALRRTENLRKRRHQADKKLEDEVRADLRNRIKDDFADFIVDFAENGNDQSPAQEASRSSKVQAVHVDRRRRNLSVWAWSSRRSACTDSSWTARHEPLGQQHEIGRIQGRVCTACRTERDSSRCLGCRREAISRSKTTAQDETLGEGSGSRLSCASESTLVLSRRCCNSKRIQVDFTLHARDESTADSTESDKGAIMKQNTDKASRQPVPHSLNTSAPGHP